MIEQTAVSRRTWAYRWLFLVLPAYAAFAFGRSSWPLAAAFAVAIVLYNLALGAAERRWPEWAESRAVFQRCVEIGLACIALSLIYLKGLNATLFEFYYDGFYAVPVIFSAAAAGRRGLLWSAIAATAAVAFGQVLLTAEPALLWGRMALDYWLGVATYSAIYGVFFATVGGLALFGREYSSRRQRDLVLKLAGSFSRLRESVIVTDAAGRVASMNDRAESLFGYRSARLFGQRIARLCPDLDRRSLSSSAATSEPRQLICRRRDGGEIACEITVSAYEAEGEIAAFVLIARDVSSRLRIEEQMAQQSRLATIGTLASGVAHDINSPLAGIRNLAEVLLEDPRPEHESEALCMIRDEAKRVATMVRDVLNFVRADRSGRTAVKVDEIVDRALKLRELAPRNARVTVRREYAEPAPHVVANAAQLEQIVLNLVTNGEQAMAARGGELVVRTRVHDGQVRIEVQDSGPGIPPELADRIFEPFFTTKAPDEGTGLGLAIARDIVRQHGGELDVQNRPGQGATFIVRLPIAFAGDGKLSGLTAALRAVS